MSARNGNGERHTTLLALTSSAMLLPAYQGAQADAPPEYTELGLRYSKYKEDDIPGRKSFGSGSERYDIDVAQFHLLAPVADSWSVALDVAWEDMSGASPWFVGESADGDPRVIMSGASIEDTRTEVSVNTRYYYDRGNAGLSYTNSDEDDYQSDAVSLDGAFNSADGMRTYAAAISASWDDIEPTQGAVPTNTLQDDKDIRSAWIGVSQIVSKRAIVRFGLSYTYRDGFLTDPYKNRDSRPDERKEWTASAGYRHFFQQQDAALHVDYRYFDDDWDVVSHTLDLSWHQNVNDQLQLIPFLRYYSQDEAEFFDVVADTSQRYYADDYRLSAFGAFTYGLRLRRELGNWSLNLAGERYKSDESWGLYSGDEAPGLVDYWRYSLGVDYVFR
ncbi:MAG: hypothetical protein CME59_15730 [Halioglobus sp.]|mgnify:CR=1 FL=1|nr:hypothetical protein [Halioglobus sp.]|tara:strand:- start:118 stop:1284 length:1167 start_codon:yes stop_codon:yes gene_type:complete